MAELAVLYEAMDFPCELIEGNSFEECTTGIVVCELASALFDEESIFVAMDDKRDTELVVVYKAVGFFCELEEENVFE